MQDSILGSWKSSVHTSVQEKEFDLAPIGESIFGIWMPPTNWYQHMIITIKYKDNFVPPTCIGATLLFGVHRLS